MRKNAAPSTPPSVAKTAPAKSSTTNPKTRPIDGIGPERLEHRAHFGRQVTRVAREVARQPLLKRRHHDVQHDRDDEPDDGAQDPGQQSGQCATAYRDRSRIVLLIEICAEHTTAYDPETTAEVAQVDDRQGRQDADEKAAKDGRLANRSTPAPDA